MDYLWILLIVSLAASAVGWIYFIYFFSIGYGLAIAALATTTIIIFANNITLPAIIFCCTLFIYGLRLATYLLIREKSSASYKKILYQPDKAEKKSTKTMLMIWISCALLYIGQTSPITFYLHNLKTGTTTNDVWVWTGAIIAIIGLTIETVADVQKSIAKKRSPNLYVDNGLYRIVRCPNYFGELVIWSGSFITCFSANCTPWQWFIASLGYGGIIYVMFSGARRLELRQADIYGSNPSFQEYTKHTPLIIPLLPIHSLAKLTWLKA